MFTYCNNNPVNGVDNSGALPIKIDVSIEMLETAINGDGSDQFYSEESVLVDALKHSQIMKALIETKIQAYNISEGTEYAFSGSVSLYGKENKYDFDLSYSVGKASYSMLVLEETRERGVWFFKREQTRTMVIVKISDTYDFDEWRSDDSLGSKLNNLGYLWQESGVVTPYSWCAVYTVYGRWQ